MYNFLYKLFCSKRLATTDFAFAAEWVWRESQGWGFGKDFGACIWVIGI